MLRSNDALPEKDRGVVWKKICLFKMEKKNAPYLCNRSKNAVNAYGVKFQVDKNWKEKRL